MCCNPDLEEADRRHSKSGRSTFCGGYEPRVWEFHGDVWGFSDVWVAGVVLQDEQECSMRREKGYLKQRVKQQVQSRGVFFLTFPTLLARRGYPTSEPHLG